MSEYKAIIHASELDFITRCVLDYSNVETGGDFFGFWNKDGMPVIQFVTGPGEKTTRSSTSFYQDIDYLHKTGNYLHDNYALEHIGSWHSHHTLGLNQPSSGDINTMRNCLNTQNINKFFITICNIIKSDRVTINGFLFANDLPNIHQKSNWVVLKGDSPIRLEIEKTNNIFINPKTKKGKFEIDESSLNSSQTIIPDTKIDFPENSFFKTKEGKKFLKSEYDKICSFENTNDVEIQQNEDQSISITFSIDGKDIEIKYPIDFSTENPNPILIEKINKKKEIKHKLKSEHKLMHLGIFDWLNVFNILIFGGKTNKSQSQSQMETIELPEVIIITNNDDKKDEPINIPIS